MKPATAFLLAFLVMSTSAQAAAPAHGASCSEFTAGANACNANGCFICSSGSWVDQPLYIGTSSATCDASHEGLHRYNSTSKTTEVCNGSAWSALQQAGTTSGITAASGTGYFVLTHTAWNGNLGNISGADAKCLTELSTTYTSWRGYSTANSNGQLTSGKVHAYICNEFTCNNLMPLTTYYFAYANSGTPGGASFTTDNTGLGPGDSNAWSAANYFSGTYNYWAGRDSDPGTGVTPSLWTSRPLGSTYTNCTGWSDSTVGQTAVSGNSANTNQNRWDDNYQTCNTTQRLICFVNP
ncbi:MAG: hypothetical protein KBA75_04055 [Alphaproteobacteria bacterium]|nr:hypothetical protein [Alphaproteobacteria bacterium]